MDLVFESGPHPPSLHRLLLTYIIYTISSGSKPKHLVRLWMYLVVTSRNYTDINDDWLKRQSN